MRTVTIKSYSHAIKYAGGHQVNAQQLLNGRMYGGSRQNWVKVNLSDEFREQLIEDLVNIAGGHHKTRQYMRSTLTHGRPQHWALERMLVNERGLSYCAGQDYTWEMRELRKKLA